jgi:integrase
VTTSGSTTDPRRLEGHHRPRPRRAHAAGAAAVDPQTQRWTLQPATQHPLLGAVDLHGAHDFRHTFSTWLEDAGIPARVIDELMGHQPSGRAGRHEASAIGAHYRHTTPEMAARVLAAVEERLVIVLATAEAALDQQPLGLPRSDGQG